MHLIPCALVLDFANAGKIIDAKIAMIAITTNSSIRVKPFMVDARFVEVIIIYAWSSEINSKSENVNLHLVPNRARQISEPKQYHMLPRCLEPDNRLKFPLSFVTQLYQSRYLACMRKLVNSFDSKNE